MKGSAFPSKLRASSHLKVMSFSGWTLMMLYRNDAIPICSAMVCICWSESSCSRLFLTSLYARSMISSMS